MPCVGPSGCVRSVATDAHGGPDQRSDWALIQAWGGLQLAMGPFADLAQNILIGGWMVVGPLAAYILRRPGAATITEMLAGLRGSLAGRPGAVTAVLVTTWQLGLLRSIEVLSG